MRQPYRHVVVFFNEVYNYGTCYTRNSATILSFFFDSDSWKFSICQVNDLSVILSHACIRQIFCNGTTSWKLYQKYMKPQYAVDAVKLPSTSPANAAFSLERLTEEWSVILPYLKNPS